MAGRENRSGGAGSERGVVAGLLASIRRRLVARRIKATGLFDAAYYRATNPSVAASGVDPIRHYVKRGAAQGRDPHPMFDTSWYLQENPDVTGSGMNPLLHFATKGAAEGRRPHPRHAPEEYLRAAADRARGGEDAGAASRNKRGRRARRLRLVARPFDGSGRSAERPAGGGAATATILVCHVLPFPPRAGNEYRIHRLLRRLRAAGHEVHLVISPLPGDRFDPENVRRAAREYPNLVICERDGTFRYQAEREEVRAALAGLDGARVGRFRRLRGRGRIAEIERVFCPDHLLHVLERLGQAVRPGAVVASYVFTTRCLRLFPRGVLRIVDTHDVFSTKAEKVVRFGVADDLALSPAEEGELLRRADLVVAIQPEEARELRALAPDRRVVTAGVDFDLAPEAPPAADPVVLCVASGNALNVRGARELLSFAWPLVRREVPGARLRIVGPVCDALEPADGVELLGRVDRLDDAYAGARVVVNPAVAGTGLKIKTLEALSYLRPLVSWPSGVDGLTPAARKLCFVATDWYEFARHVVRLLAAEAAPDLAAHREELRRLLSPEAVYADLLLAMERPGDERLAAGDERAGVAA